MTSAIRGSAPCRTRALDQRLCPWGLYSTKPPNPNKIYISLWGVLGGPTLGSFLRGPEIGEQPAQLFGRQW
jgi:hypothetical protein